MTRSYCDEALEAATAADEQGLTGQRRQQFIEQWTPLKSRKPQPPPSSPDDRREQKPRPKASWLDSTILAQELCDKEFPTLKYVVPGLFPEGVVLLASRPKLGKSWLLQQIGSAVANGDATLITGDDKPVQGDVLYLNLEDGERRAQRRMTKYFGAMRENWPARMRIARMWRRLDQGGLDDLREWCRSVTKPTLIMIDILKRVRPPKRAGSTDYEADYEACQGLLELSREFPGLVIIVSHHDRKMDADDVFDTVSGTLGLTGGVDTIAILKRSAQGISLHIEGRDLIEAVEKAVTFDRETCRWQILGEAAEVHRSAVRSRVLDALQGVPGDLTVAEIMAAADIQSRTAADVLLHRMAKDGEIERRGRGRYGLPGTPLKEVKDSQIDSKTPDNTGISSASNTSYTSYTPPQVNGLNGCPTVPVPKGAGQWDGQNGTADQPGHLSKPAPQPPSNSTPAATALAGLRSASFELPDIPLCLRRAPPNPDRAPALGPPGDSLDDLDPGWPR
jgi:hypothetical protein